jgi:sugar phosphate isomerase/epimerase
LAASAAAGLGAPAVHSEDAVGKRPTSGRLPIAFSTLGCPAWDWATIVEQADRLGYAAIELRGVSGEMDLPKVPEFQPSRLAESRDRVTARGLRIVSLDSSAAMHEPEGPARTARLDEARRFIDLAHAIGAPYVRVFPDKLVPGEEKSATIDRIGAGLRILGNHAKDSGVIVLVESHGDFTRSPDLKEILSRAGTRNVGLLWDAHHTVVSGHESPADTFRFLGSFVKHTHLKDSRPDKDGVRYVLTGDGTVPVQETVRVLAASGYTGYYCFEWEKKWHPEIEEPEVALPHYARTMSGYLTAAEVKPLP